MAARLSGARSVISSRHGLVAPPYKLVQELKYAMASKFCDSVVGICDATCDNLRQAPFARKSRILRIYNGAVPIDPPPVSQRPPKTGFTLVYVGRFAPVKDHSTLLKALELARQSAPDLHLWMVGDGPERQSMENLVGTLGIAENVTFWGQQMNVAPFFSGADAFIMSSVSEGLPISLLQAMSVGLPAIVTDVGGMAEVVRFAKAGITTPVGDPAAMARAILDVVKDPCARTRFSQSAATCFRQSFTLEAMANAYMNLYTRTSTA